MPTPSLRLLLVIGFALSLSGAASAQSGDPDFVVGDIVMNRSTLNVREDATLASDRVGRVPFRSFGVVIDGPTDADNYSWYQIEWANGLSGWSVSRYLVKKASTGTALPTLDEPNGGEVLTLGQNTPVELAFTNGTPPPLALFLMRSSRKLGALVVATSSTGSYTWEAGKYTDRDGTKTAFPGFRYRIAVLMAGIPETVDTSDTYFELRSAGGTPTPTPTPSPTPTPGSGLGVIKVKRVGSDLTVSTAPTTSAGLDVAIPNVSTNPTRFADVTAGTHTVVVTDVAGYTETGGKCTTSDLSDGEGCNVTSFPLTPTCASGVCTFSIEVLANIKTKLAVRYLADAGNGLAFAKVSVDGVKRFLPTELYVDGLTPYNTPNGEQNVRIVPPGGGSVISGDYTYTYRSGAPTGTTFKSITSSKPAPGSVPTGPTSLEQTLRANETITFWYNFETTLVILDQNLVTKGTYGWPTLKVSAKFVKPGATIGITLSGKGFGPEDYVWLALATEPTGTNGRVISYQYLDGGAKPMAGIDSFRDNIVLLFTMPQTAGTYELRYNTASAGGGINYFLARSVPIVVSATAPDHTPPKADPAADTGDGGAEPIDPNSRAIQGTPCIFGFPGCARGLTCKFTPTTSQPYLSTCQP